MSTKEIEPMSGYPGAAQLHINELDREIEAIRIEQLLSAAHPHRRRRTARARAAVGRTLIALGVALVGETRGHATRTAGNRRSA
jgi:hypothetical protein